MTTKINSARELLEAAYNDLNFTEGDLCHSNVDPENLTTEEWIEKGDWLSLAKQVGAESIFFVQNNPVIVFASREAQDDEVLRQAFNDIWCMARPQRLFLARQGELAVYDLTQPPVQKAEEWQKKRPIAVAKSVAEVATELYKYRREQVESGKVFEEEERFGKPNQRADRSLIRDLKTVRADLRAKGLDGNKLKYAHALIGRSIFIRYLEDRGILDWNYFNEVAQKNPEWQVLLNAPSDQADLEREAGKLYLKVLSNQDFTYALFDKLSKDFNGDMFPSDPQEKKEVTEDHLKLLQQFLRGDTQPQKKLFFWAYKFSIIPIALISSIYEEFYHNVPGSSDSYGTHYTPTSLVEFVLSQVLTEERLAKNPRILDPCCGSGIFLVESFRRVIRYQKHKQNKKRLEPEELRQILCNQIAGIEINEEAIRITAFSLYLALLHYQEPPEIWRQIEQGQRLPYLKYNIGNLGDQLHFNNLLRANAFDIASEIQDEFVLSRFSSSCADVVVGNPPWGAPVGKDVEGTTALEIALNWCKEHDYPVGGKERSQAFIWRTLDLLRDGGWAGLLVSTGVLLKQHPNSQAFRREWLSKAELREVVNFAHVRDIFFRDISDTPKKSGKKLSAKVAEESDKDSSAIAPFASVLFQKSQEEIRQKQDHYICYWSAKKTAMVQNLQAVILGSPDRHLVRQRDVFYNDSLWKTYWWGNHRDAALISALELATPLEELHDPKNSGQGFSKGRKDTELSDWLLEYRKLPVDKFQKYGPIDRSWFEQPPGRVTRRRKQTLYKGDRLLIKHGITQSSDKKGEIIARMESDDFCFTNSINCIKLKEPATWKYKVILGIIWSSLPRYYFFLTASKWGMWHYGIHKEEYLRMPICLPEDRAIRNQIIEIVEQLQNWNPLPRSLMHLEGKTEEEIGTELAALEERLDEAVFDLYELSTSERDLVRDMCNVGIEFFYNHTKSEAVKPVDKEHPPQVQGFYEDIPFVREPQKGLEGYLYVFLQIWNRELEPDGEFCWRIVCPERNSSMLAVIFSTQEKGEPLPEISNSDEQEWLEILQKLGNDENGLLVPYNSKQIYIDGLVRALTDTDIIIIKRNERRLWTRSMAREDAEATLLQAINLQEAMEGTSQ